MKVGAKHLRLNPDEKPNDYIRKCCALIQIRGEQKNLVAGKGASSLSQPETGETKPNFSHPHKNLNPCQLTPGSIW